MKVETKDGGRGGGGGGFKLDGAKIRARGKV